MLEMNQEDKADRKESAAAANDKTRFKDTAFGRRRVRKIPNWLAILGGLIAAPIVFLHRRLARSSRKPR
jgi:hypothetical protein